MSSEYGLVEFPDESVASAGGIDTCVFEQGVDGQLVHRLLFLLLAFPLGVPWVVHVDEQPLYFGLFTLIDEPLMSGFVYTG